MVLVSKKIKRIVNHLDLTNIKSILVDKSDVYWLNNYLLRLKEWGEINRSRLYQTELSNEEYEKLMKEYVELINRIKHYLGFLELDINKIKKEVKNG